MAKRSWQIVAPVRPRINRAMLLAVLGLLASMAAILLIAHSLKLLLAGQSAKAFLAWLVVLVAAGFLLRGTAFRISHLAAFDLETILRHKLSAHIQTLSFGFIHAFGASSLSKIMQDDVRELHLFVADSTPLYARVYAAPIFTILVLLYLDWRMALVCVGAIAIGAVTMGLIMRTAGDSTRDYIETREQVSKTVVEYVQAMQVVRTFDNGASSFGRYTKALDKALEFLQKWYRQNGLMARFSMAIFNPLPSVVLILWIGAYWWWGQSLSFATWLAILLIGTGIAEAFMPYFALIHLLQRTDVSIQRIEELLAVKPLPMSANPQQPADNSIEFSDVSFSYAKRNRKALNSVSFKVEAGSFTAIIGDSGAGKSTVARLLARFWDVDSGAISIGGVDIREIHSQDFLGQVGMVLQENFLFADTVSNNIKLGAPTASDAEVIAAAKAAQIHDFIESLPEGYATNCGERGNLFSGGERQRITIARAILQNRPILVLDEATSFADASNEAALLKALGNLLRGKTVLMIAHRLGSIQNCDNILLFKAGELCEAGSPQTLLAAGGEYANLIKAWQQTQNWHIGKQAEQKS